MIGIYKITNKINGKIYIGQSDNIERRFNEHKKIKNLTIDDYISFYGINNFNFEILEECQINELDYKEQEYIKKFNSRINGYNITSGGQNNSVGEGNGRSKLNNQDIIYIRTCYNNHKKQKDIYKEFKDKITWSQFQAIWQGHSWSHIMPEVFTEENKQWYVYNNSRGENSAISLLTDKEVLKFRQEYVNNTARNIYIKYQLDKKIKYKTFQKILIGETYNYNIPVYKKTQKQWYLNNEPVSTISVSGE